MLFLSFLDYIYLAISCYNNSGTLITGTGTDIIKYTTQSFSFTHSTAVNTTYTYNVDFTIKAVAYSSANYNYGFSNLNNITGYTNIPVGLIIGSQTQMLCQYTMAGSGSITWLITRVSDTQVAAKLVSRGVNGSASAALTLYIIGI